MRDTLLKTGILVLFAAIALAYVMADKSSLSDEIGRVQGVALVERSVSPSRPACRIIHIADFHLISSADFRAYLRRAEPGISDAEAEEQFQALKATVRMVQQNQLSLIRWLAKEHGVRIVHLEGLTEDNAHIYAKMVQMVRDGDLDYGLIHAPGQALIAGDIEAVAPAEEEATYLAAESLAGDAIEADGPENDAREEAIVRRLVAAGPLSVVVLGLEHDLSRHIKAIGDCEYMRVYVDGLGD